MSDRITPPNKTKAGAIHNDPWGDRGNQGPPDLDEAIKKLQGQLSGLFGGGSSGGGGSGGGFLKGSIYARIFWRFCRSRGCLRGLGYLHGG